jgi:hypothetical protein
MFDRVAPIRWPSSVVLAAILAVVTGCSSAPTSAAPVAVASANSAPTIAVAPPTTNAATSIPTSSARASDTPTPTPSAPASAPPLPDGDYVGGVITHSTAAAMLKDPKVANDAGVKSYLAEFGATYRGTLHLANSRWELFESLDGGALDLGDRGTFAFVDDHTIAMQGNSGTCNGIFGFSIHGERLKLTELKDSCGAADLAVGRVIYESTAWTRKP